jgi:hypothetical protein
MNKSDKSLRQEAAKLFALHDITLFESRFERGDLSKAEGTIQTKRSVRYTKNIEMVDGEETPSLQVLVTLGSRVVEQGSEPDDDAAMLFMIEADYLVKYRITGDISDEAAKAFAHFNVVHNVWPFWRQHVFYVVQQGRLPHIEIPLFTG